ncbi:MAG: ABC transporter ATP-binding protein [Culicoidibacterales bacterium]
MIALENISKYFGDKTAVKNLTLTIQPGEIFGLIGHNGAGKTTTLKMMMNIIEPSEGKILFDDQSYTSGDEYAIKKKIGYVPDTPDLFVRTRAIDFLNFVADAYGVDEATRRERIQNFSRMLGIESDLVQTIQSFSHGMRQKVALIAALIANPDYWILDEPLTGLDPEASYRLKEMMREHANSGKSVLFSTHGLEVAEKLCDRIGIMKAGELVFVGTMDELRANETGTLEEIYLRRIVGVDINE